MTAVSFAWIALNTATRLPAFAPRFGSSSSGSASGWGAQVITSFQDAHIRSAQTATSARFFVAQAAMLTSRVLPTRSSRILIPIEGDPQ